MLAWYGIPADPGDLALRRPGGRHPRGLTLVHPGAKAAQRRWPPERFAAVARQLAARGHRVVVTGSAGERDLAEDVAERAGLPRRAALAGRTDTGQLAALVAGARLLISGDTGIAHLATAYGTPSVLLFGPMSPALWGPPPDRPWHRVLWHAPLAARPGEPDRVHPALRAITADEVLAAVAHVEDVAAAVGAGSAMRWDSHAVAAQ
jgi:ADP-heptose:LPS heptosyltransferase